MHQPEEQGLGQRPAGKLVRGEIDFQVFDNSVSRWKKAQLCRREKVTSSGALFSRECHNGLLFDMK